MKVVFLEVCRAKNYCFSYHILWSIVVIFFIKSIKRFCSFQLLIQVERQELPVGNICSVAHSGKCTCIWKIIVCNVWVFMLFQCSLSLYIFLWCWFSDGFLFLGKEMRVLSSFTLHNFLLFKFSWELEICN